MEWSASGRRSRGDPWGLSVSQRTFGDQPEPRSSLGPRTAHDEIEQLRWALLRYFESGMPWSALDNLRIDMGP